MTPFILISVLLPVQDDGTADQRVTRAYQHLLMRSKRLEGVRTFRALAKEAMPALKAKGGRKAAADDAALKKANAALKALDQLVIELLVGAPGDLRAWPVGLRLGLSFNRLSGFMFVATEKNRDQTQTFSITNSVIGSTRAGYLYVCLAHSLSMGCGIPTTPYHQSFYHD